MKSKRASSRLSELMDVAKEPPSRQYSGDSTALRSVGTGAHGITKACGPRRKASPKWP